MTNSDLYPQPGRSGFLVVRCESCTNLTAVQIEYTGGANNDGQISRVLALFPTRSSALTLSATPQHVTAAIGEAEECLAVGAITASALVCRRALQLLCRDQEVPQGSLKDEIDALTVPDLLKTTAHAIRLIVNEAAHPDPTDWDRITADDVTQLIDLAVQLAEHTYELPARMRTLNERAQDFSR